MLMNAKRLLLLTAALSAVSFSASAAKMYLTADGEQQPFKEIILEAQPYQQAVEKEFSVFVDTLHQFQTIIGFGGSITDASAEVYARLPKAKQKEFMQAYFDADKGIGYNLVRVSIQSNDFSSAQFSYVEPGDTELKTFQIDYDKKYRIPMIREALRLMGNDAKVYASPWSPPAWMKSNGEKLHGGYLLPQYRQAWADCYVRFIQEYGKAGVPIWGLTVQNEPLANQIWESCLFTAEEERDFVRDYLGPTLWKAGMKDVKLMVWDHNRDLLFQRGSVILNDKEAAKYVWGIGYHWYEDRTGGPSMNFSNLRLFHECFPDVQMAFTEGSGGRFKLGGMEDWSRGERFGYSMIQDLNHGACLWTNWNILLDEEGGPTHVGNFCFAPIHGNTVTGELTYTNSYYYIGHFSKFIRPGARRVACASSREDLLATAAINKDGKLVVVAMNRNDFPLVFLLQIGQHQYSVNLPAHSIATVLPD